MSNIHCMFCGGKECKYENWRLWTGDKDHPNAIDGLFSNWITNDILATQRPSSRIIKEYGIIETFKKHQIKAIFNLQQLNEHQMCGDGVLEKTGFSYDPQEFMDAGISHYNFSWTDMDTPTPELVLNIVQVMSSVLTKPGDKFAVHCHAGLGRTGLSIACYLVYSKLIPATTAIELVRAQRPLSLQTKSQCQFVHDFEIFLYRLRTIFPMKQEQIIWMSMSLRELIMNQRMYYHGEDIRIIGYVPKVLKLCVNSIVNLLKRANEEERRDTEKMIVDTVFSMKQPNNVILNMIVEINSGDYRSVVDCEDLVLLVQLILYLLLCLKLPLINKQSLELLQESDDDGKGFDQVAIKMRKDVFYFINCVMDVFRECSQLDSATLRSTLFIVAGYMTPNRLNFIQNKKNSPSQRNLQAFFSDFRLSRNAAQIEKRIIQDKIRESQAVNTPEDPIVADDLQYHTARFLDYLLEHNYDYKPGTTGSPVAMTVDWYKMRRDAERDKGLSVSAPSSPSTIDLTEKIIDQKIEE